MPFISKDLNPIQFCLPSVHSDVKEPGAKKQNQKAIRTEFDP